MVDLINRMIEQAKNALDYAYAPYSNYHVAACLCTENGNLYTGVNVENASYGLTICAESAAICNMVVGGEQKIKSIVVLNGENTLCSCCGACRQRIIEFSSIDTLVHLCSHTTVIQSVKIDQLLPLAFSLKT